MYSIYDFDILILDFGKILELLSTAVYLITRTRTELALKVCHHACDWTLAHIPSSFHVIRVGTFHLSSLQSRDGVQGKRWVGRIAASIAEILKCGIGEY